MSDIIALAVWIYIIYKVAIYLRTRQTINNYTEKHSLDDFENYLAFRKHWNTCNRIKASVELDGMQYDMTIKGYWFIRNFPDINGQEIKNHFINKRTREVYS